MSRRRVTGICRLCGVEGALSFEHTPPRSAFNDRPVIAIPFNEAIHLGPDAVPRGPVQQRGAGRFSFCPRCNNLTGHWYGGAFVEWCYASLPWLMKSGGCAAHACIFPLRVIKQIATMFFSLEAERFHACNPELVHFVLNRDETHLPARYRVFLYANWEGRLRASGLLARSDFGTGRAVLFSEVTYPPFGYVMTFDSPPPDPRLLDISRFSHWSYTDRVTVTLQLSLLATHLAIPGDYRTKAEIYRDYEANVRSTRRSPGV